MTEDTIRQVALIRKRIALLDNIVIGETEYLPQALDKVVAPSMPLPLREHMVNSVGDTKILLAALDDSENNVDKLLTEVQRLHKQLKEQEAKIKTYSEDIDDEYENGTYIPYDLKITWLNGGSTTFNVTRFELHKEMDNLILYVEDGTVFVPLSGIRYYVVIGH